MTINWQPMECAPRDGTRVIAATPVYNTSGRFMHWDIHVIFCNDETGQIHADCYLGWDWDDYEAWQPCPEPPDTAPAHVKETSK